MKDFAVTTHKFCIFATLLRPTESMDNWVVLAARTSCMCKHRAYY